MLTSTHLETIKEFGTPQVVTVVRHMVDFGHISGNVAHSYRIRSLPRRICDLESILSFFRIPVRIGRKWKKDLYGQRYVEYSLISR